MNSFYSKELTFLQRWGRASMNYKAIVGMLFLLLGYVKSEIYGFCYSLRYIEMMLYGTLNALLKRKRIGWFSKMVCLEIRSNLMQIYCPLSLYNIYLVCLGVLILQEKRNSFVGYVPEFKRIYSSRSKVVEMCRIQ